MHVFLYMTKKLKLILASASPRRSQLLKEAGLKFVIAKSNYDENNEENIPVQKLVLKHAIGKAKDVLSRYKEGLILGADTIVVLGDEIIGKPKGKKDAERILKKLSGKTHQVFTGFVLIDAKTKKIISKIAMTKVTFKKISDAMIVEYLSTSEYMDKAGAYAFQGRANKFIAKVIGSKTNVIGLPMEDFLEELKKFH